MDSASAIQGYSDVAMTQMASPAAPTAGKLPANVDKAAQDFEAMFFTQMMQPMFDGLDADPTFGGGHGEDVMRTFLLQEYGKIAAKSGQLGLTSSVRAEMIKMQAARSDPGSRNAANSKKGGAAYAANQ